MLKATESVHFKWFLKGDLCESYVNDGRSQGENPGGLASKAQPRSCAVEPARRSARSSCGNTIVWEAPGLGYEGYSARPRKAHSKQENGTSKATKNPIMRAIQVVLVTGRSEAGTRRKRSRDIGRGLFLQHPICHTKSPAFTWGRNITNYTAKTKVRDSAGECKWKASF